MADRLDAAPESVRDRLALKLRPQGFLHRAGGRKLGRELGVSVDLAFHRQRAGEVELAVEIGMDQQNLILGRHLGVLLTSWAPFLRRDSS